MERLYFWFTRQTFVADEDLVKHGEKADSCFVILSGRCNVIVPLNEEELAEQAAEQARNAPPKRQSKLRRKSTHGEEEGGPAPRRNSVSGRTSNAHGEGESGPPARRNSVVGASGPVEEVSDGSDRLQGLVAIAAPVWAPTSAQKWRHPPGSTGRRPARETLELL